MNTVTLKKQISIINSVLTQFSIGKQRFDVSGKLMEMDNTCKLD